MGPDPTVGAGHGPATCDVLERSFDLAARRGDGLVREFYRRLFEAEPGVRGLFPDDMRSQRAMLWTTLRTLRVSLRDLPALENTLRALGRRHAAYGAEPDHYPVVARGAGRDDGG
jgi:hemoglobin-like flavoprotein